MSRNENTTPYPAPSGRSATYASTVKPPPQAGATGVEAGSDGASSSATISDNGTAKPVFLKNRDVLPMEGKLLSHEELYTAIHKQLGSTKGLTGLQRIGGLWRIYLDDRIARVALISAGLSVRGARAPVYDTNPYLRNNDGTAGTRITVKDIPLSVKDEVIVNEMEKLKINVKSKVQRLKLRVNGFLTDCYNGDRALFVETPLKPLPRTMRMGAFTARVYHEGQSNAATMYSKCLAQGHHASACTRPVVCRKCHQPGHKGFECSQQNYNIPINTEQNKNELNEENVQEQMKAERGNEASPERKGEANKERPPLFPTEVPV